METPSPNRTFLERGYVPPEKIDQLAELAVQPTSKGIQSRMKLIEIARRGNEYARVTLTTLAKVIAPQYADKKSFRKPKKLAAPVIVSKRTTLTRDAADVRDLDGRRLSIQEVLQKGGIAGTKKVPQYIQDAIAWKMQKATGKVNPLETGTTATLGIKPTAAPTPMDDIDTSEMEP